MKKHKRNTKRSKEDNLVITPGGPRPKEQVHPIRPGEGVLITDEGEAVVFPHEVTILRPEERTARMATDLILTPGGYRHRSLVHRVEPGHAVHVTGEQTRIMNLSTKAMIDIPKVAIPREACLLLGSGWIAASYWNNETGRPITSFRTTWRVPPAPTTRSNQLIYLFNGITRFSGNSAILQPVLQWGSSPDGGGPFWAVASWYVHTTGQAFYTPLIQVNVGDILVGVMTLTSQSGNSYSYYSQFEGLAGTSLPVLNIDELAWCSETLEAYGVAQCSDYPATAFTPFQAISIQTGNIAPPLNWAVDNKVTDCGQHAVIVNNSATDGEVDIYYRDQS